MAQVRRVAPASALPTVEAAKAWYQNPIYCEARQHRLKGGDYRAVTVEST
jgi:hypothetical protein